MQVKGSFSHYDKIYAAKGKDYQKEVDYLVAAITSHIGRKHITLLDVACGTGGHLLYLQKHYHVEGVDASLDFIRIARSRLPKTKFYVGDMRTFNLGREYDVVTCMFSSIGFMQTPKQLHLAIRNMARHAKQGGLLIVEPWYSPGQIMNGKLSLTVVDEGRLKVVRMYTVKLEGSMSCLEFHYLVGTPKGTEHFVERHRQGLHTKEEMREAFEKSGVSMEYDEKGPTGKGLYIGGKK